MLEAIYNWFYEPLSFPFMQQALVTALLVAFVCALLSCYLVLKGWSLMGDAISHAVLPGIVLAFVLGVPKQEFILILVISLFTSAVILSKRKDFLLYCFDPVQAKIVGLPVKLLHYALLTLLALTIIAAMQVVGVILVVALLIAPGITAFCLTKRFDHMLLIAIGVSVFSTFIGTLLSYHLDAATGPTIVLVQSLLFVTALCIRALKTHAQQRALRAQAKLS